MSRREQSARKISTCAQALTASKGFEGFTMEDLAGAAGVSRRTLFNYFDSKLEAVLGPEPELDTEMTAEFRAGGPTGHLFEDLGHVAHTHFARMPQNRELITTMRQVIRNPRIMAACHDRFEKLAEDGLAMIKEREGSHYDERQARVAISMLLVLCQLALDGFVATTDDRTFTDHYDECLSAARAVLA
ncbi:TetR/AcrR family transcriptional regulator [Nocardioides alcanivorans]|uniref:TetR/AcrR family transcriptional regulator n=1 Tax=Nocardioides alcanivorans TaxID=2897352 RepID=UPI001F192AE6|nr:TetR/AcrR family transcriptional regulator [Nocardioides alcanivorans]